MSYKINQQLGVRIQRVRKAKKMTQEELAEKVGISRAYMGYIEQGRNVPSLKVLQRIAKVLKITLSNLLD